MSVVPLTGPIMISTSFDETKYRFVFTSSGHQLHFVGSDHPIDELDDTSLVFVRGIRLDMLAYWTDPGPVNWSFISRKILEKQWVRIRSISQKPLIREDFKKPAIIQNIKTNKKLFCFSKLHESEILRGLSVEKRDLGCYHESNNKMLYRRMISFYIEFDEVGYTGNF